MLAVNTKETPDGCTCESGADLRRFIFPVSKEKTPSHNRKTMRLLEESFYEFCFMKYEVVSNGILFVG